jgi:HK97 gp10 family phage protein
MATRILGLAALERKINRLPVAAKAAMQVAIGQMADEIVALAKGLVPVDSGDLKDSIAWTWGKVPKGALTLGKVAAATIGGDLTATVYAGNDKAYYARWVEFGTAPHINGGMFAGRQNRGTHARPFFYPAYRANKKPGLRRIRAAVRKSARDVAAGR